MIPVSILKIGSRGSSPNIGSKAQGHLLRLGSQVESQGWVQRLGPKVGLDLLLGEIGVRKQNQLVTQVGCFMLDKVVLCDLMLIELGQVSES